MSELWNSIVGTNEKENREEITTLYFDKCLKYFSVSEVDKEETPIVFSEADKRSLNKAALNFVTIFYIDTRKGLCISDTTGLCKYVTNTGCNKKHRPYFSR